MNAADYRPRYDPGVYEFMKDGNGAPIPQTVIRVHPQYCLLYPYAMILAPLFAGTEVGVPTIYMDAPNSQALGSPRSFSRNVPWFKFTVNGAEVLRNAGYLSIYWGQFDLSDQSVNPMGGVPYTASLAYAVVDVKTLVEGQ
jgi:hypothetical protein